jgi:hypothetical protein
MKTTKVGSALVILLMAASLFGLDIVPAHGFRGECKRVVCFDGSVHECGFDCKSLIRNRPAPRGSRGRTYIPSVPSGPTPQQLEKEREGRVEDLNEKGFDAYERGDFASAARYFRVALEYDPHNPTLKHNLRRAEGKVREAEARRRDEARRRAEARNKALEEAAAAAAHAKKAASIVSVAPEKAGKEARKVFDGRGDRTGVSVPASVVVGDTKGMGRPLKIPPALANHPEIQRLQKEKTELVDQVKGLETKLGSIQEKKAKGQGNKGELEVQEAKTKQEISNLTSKIGVVDVKMEDFVINLSKEKKPSEAAAGKGK